MLQTGVSGRENHDVRRRGFAVCLHRIWSAAGNVGAGTMFWVRGPGWGWNTAHEPRWPPSCGPTYVHGNCGEAPWFRRLAATQHSHWLKRDCFQILFQGHLSSRLHGHLLTLGPLAQPCPSPRAISGLCILQSSPDVSAVVFLLCYAD